MNCSPRRGLAHAILMASALTLALPVHAQTAPTRYPVVSKVEILFSMVSHYSHISDRMGFYNNNGNPRGNTNYAVPHLVYEPLVTLYNPYNQDLTMNRSRIKIWDPPVGFTFKKNNAWLRSDFATGNFHGIGRLQIANQFNANARKSFTMLLSELQPNSIPGGAITLRPGESKTFSAWVEPAWSWGLENGTGEYTPRSFFDWNADSQFTDRDNRTANPFGIEAIASTTPFLSSAKAGYQTDGLTFSDGQRPYGTLYEFETSWAQNYNWVAIKLSDTVTVQTKSMRTTGNTGNTGIPDFRVDLLKGLVQDPTADLVKAFPMSLTGIIQNDAQPVITRTFTAGDILQIPSDKTSGGKTPFASLTMIAKTNALRENSFLIKPAVPNSSLYELHFKEATDFTGAHVLSSDAPLDAAPTILGVTRIGDILYVDFTGRPTIPGQITWKVRGSSNLAFIVPDNLDSVSTVQTGQSANGIYKAAVDISTKGERYFIRIEE